MIHLKANLSDVVNSWLDDLVDDKKEDQRENAKKKIMHAAIREQVASFQTPWMRLQTDGSLPMANGKKIDKEEVVITKLEDEPEGELVLGEKTCDRTEQAYALSRLINTMVAEKSINEWCRTLITESIIQKKDAQGRQDMEKEEAELYK